MKTHTTLGRDAIEQAEQQLGTTWPSCACAKEIAYSPPGEMGRQRLPARAWRGDAHPDRRRG